MGPNSRSKHGDCVFHNNLRKTKKKCKEYIRKRGFKIIATHGRTFVVEPTPNFMCSRWYLYLVVSAASPYLDSAIAQGKMSVGDWYAKHSYRTDPEWIEARERDIAAGKAKRSQ